MTPSSTHHRKAPTARRVFLRLLKHGHRPFRSEARQAHDGFSLVEIAMALGIFVFAIIAVLGLLTVTISSDKAAGQDTVLSQMAQTTFARLRSQPFQALVANTAYFDQSADFYFDASGALATETNGTPATTAGDSVFACVVTCKPSPSPNLYYMVMDFRWPVEAATANQQSRKVTTSVANYD